MPRSQHLTSGRWLPRAQPPESIDGELIQVASTNLSADTTTAVAVPVYATLLTGTMTTVTPASFLDILVYACFDFTGVVGDRATSFRLRLNGVLIPASRAADDNAPNDRNMSIAINRRVAIVAGLQTVLLEWSKFGTGTLQCLPATRPDQHGAHMILEEHRT